MPGPFGFIREQIQSSWNHADLKVRVILPVALVLTLITVFAGVSFYQSEQSKLLQELGIRGQAITASLSAYASGALTRGEKPALEAHVKEFIGDKKLLHHVSFYKGKTLFLTVNSNRIRDKIRPETLKHYQLPVYSSDGERVIGHVDVSLSTQKIEDYLGIRAAEITLVAVIVVLTSIVLLSWLLTRVVIQPLERLTHKIQLMSMGHLNHRVVSMSWDEIGNLFRDINALRIRFRKAENEFINSIIELRKSPQHLPAETPSRALVADDDPVVQMHAKALLEKNNIEVTLVGTGRDALEALFNHEFDLVLLDLMMPEMSGYDVLREIRKRPSYHEIPIIVISSSSDKASIVKALNNGAIDYVIKPFDNSELIARVNIHLTSALREKELDSLIEERIAGLKSL